MGMGMAPASCWTIDVEGLKKFVGEEYEAFTNVLAENDVSLENFAMSVAQGCELEAETDGVEDAITKAYEKLLKAFEKKTKLGLGIQYHDSQNDGDRYDDVNGVFWEVEGVEDFTPAGKKMHKTGHIHFSRWCMFG